MATVSLSRLLLFYCTLVLLFCGSNISILELYPSVLHWVFSHQSSYSYTPFAHFIFLLEFIILSPIFIAPTSLFRPWVDFPRRHSSWLLTSIVAPPTSPVITCHEHSPRLFASALPWLPSFYGTIHFPTSFFSSMDKQFIIIIFTSTTSLEAPLIFYCRNIHICIERTITIYCGYIHIVIEGTITIY